MASNSTLMQGDQITPALLTRSELEWLQGNKQVSRDYERQIVTMGSHSVTTGCRGADIKLPTEGEIEQGPSPSQDRVLIFSKEHMPPKPVVVGSKPTGPAKCITSIG